MKKILILLCLLFPMCSVAQDDDFIRKKATKAEKLIAEKKHEDAEKIYKELTEKYKNSGDLWTRLVQVQLMVYDDKQKYGNLFSSMKITTTTKDGKEIKDDSLSNALADLLNNFDPAGEYLENELLFSCRKACIYADNALLPSIFLRNFKVDENTNAITISDGKRYFELAEVDFSKGNYKEAITLYKKALEADPTHYKAQLYLGDCYYMLNEYQDAIREFKKAVDRKPYLLEARKYLADAYYKAGLYDKSLEACKEGYLIYPDFSMKDKLESISEAAEKKIQMHWMPRSVLPNKMESTKIADKSSEKKLQSSSKKQEAATDDWKYYQAAFETIKSECDENGIIQNSSKTKDKYLEVYSWRTMLSKSSSPEFAFAKEMNKIGFLDCYVFLSCFHYDFYEQFKHFVNNNKDQINKYFLMLQGRK